MAGIYVQAIDADNGVHWSDVFPEDYSAEQAIEAAREYATTDIELNGITFEAFYINPNRFASAKGWDGDIQLHRDGF